MLADLTRDDWLDACGLRPDEAPELAVLRGTRQLREAVDAHRARIEGARALTTESRIVDDIVIGRVGGRPVAFAAVYGASMASEVAHLLAALGARALLVAGTCGWIAPDDAGDVVVPTEAGRGDGASSYYLPAGAPRRVASDEALSDRIVALAGEARLLVRRGPVFSTAALLAESQARLARWASSGYIAAEMECAAVFAVARRFGVAASAVLGVLDRPPAGEDLARASAGAVRGVGERVDEVAFAWLAAPDAPRPTKSLTERVRGKGGPPAAPPDRS